MLKDQEKILGDTQAGLAEVVVGPHVKWQWLCFGGMLSFVVYGLQKKLEVIFGNSQRHCLFETL